MALGYDPAPPGPGAEPQFPPLLRGQAVAPGADPFAKATALAAAGRSEPGDLWYAPDTDRLRLALVFEPDRRLEEAMAMVFAMACGIHDAIGALAPPEVGATHRWPDGLLVNGALAGRLRAAADRGDRGAEPEWLTVGLTLGLAPLGADPGRMPGITSLHEEGCSDITAVRLLESIARHSLVWINRYLEEGFRPLHEAWSARDADRGGAVSLDHLGASGTSVGLDEYGNLLLRSASGTESVNILTMLDHSRDWPA